MCLMLMLLNKNIVLLVNVQGRYMNFTRNMIIYFFFQVNLSQKLAKRHSRFASKISFFKDFLLRAFFCFVTPSSLPNKPRNCVTNT